MSKERCRHGQCWVLSGGYLMWCYECGALRASRMESPTVIVADGRWQKPTGKGGKNPWEGFRKSEVKP